MRNVWPAICAYTVIVNFRFDIQIVLSIPDVVVEPSLDVCRKMLVDVSNAIVNRVSG